MGKRLLLFVLFLSSVGVRAQCTVTLSITDTIMCNGDFATLQVATQGGGGYYHYQLEYLSNMPGIWFPFSQQTTYDTATFISILANPLNSFQPSSYRITVSDTATGGCVVTGIISVTEPQPLIFPTAPISVDESALGTCDGSISVFVSGGTPPYNYLWTGPSGFTSNNQNINNLCAGIYTDTITDNNGCSISLSDTINSPNICQVSVTVTEDVSCPGGSDGAAFLSGSNYDIFSWDNLTNGQNYGSGNITTLNNLASGWYEVSCMALVGSGCPDTVSNLFQIIEPKDTIISSLSVCGSDSIPILVDVINPKDSVLYSYSIDGDSASFPDSTFSYLLQVGSHYYIVFAIDTSNGFSDTLCSFDPTFFDIVDTSITISINIDSTLVTCIGGDGSITINAVGGGGTLMYSKDGGVNYQIDSSFTNLTTGSYNVFVQESGCEQGYANNPVVIDSTSINFVVNSVTTIEESCCGDDGRIIIDIDTLGGGGTLAYSIDAGNTFFTDSILTNLTAGNYYVVVKDANGCDTALGYISISASSTPDINMSVHITDIVCHGDTNGTFRVLDPDSCYSYVLWRYTISPPYFLPVGTGTYFNGLIPGSYGVVAITNSGNCIDSSVFPIRSAQSLPLVINEPSPLIQNGISVKEVRCSNMCIPSYCTITNLGGHDTLCFSNPDSIIQIGAWNWSYKDFIIPAGFKIDAVFMNAARPGFPLNEHDFSMEYCPGTTTYNPNLPPQPLVDYNLVSTSLYNTWIDQDFNNGIGINMYNVQSPGMVRVWLPTGTSAFWNDLCIAISSNMHGLCNGEITLSSSPTGGIPPYYYSVLDYGNTIPYGPIGSDSTFSGLCTDSFEVTLFDANACKVIDTVFVADSTLYIDSIVTTNSSCFNYGNGTAIVYAHGGYTPYSYTWSNGDFTMQVDSLTNTQYSVIVSDIQNCVATDSVTITQPGELFFNIKVVGGFKPETCKGVSYDGEFHMNYQGGTTPFNWSWIGTSGATDFGFGDTIPNLTFDTLTLFVTDSNGCIGQPAWIHADSARVDALNALNPLILDTIIVDSVLCYGIATASIVINIKSGEATYSYSVDSGLLFTTDSIFTNLPAGNYNIEVRDAFGCSVYDSVIISQATEIIIFWDDTNHVKCYDDTTGDIEVHAEGGYPPYQYSWNPSGSSGNIASSLSAGMHTVSVTDAEGCIKADSLSIIELTLPLTSNAIVTSHASCYDSADGSATISVQGGMSPYTVDWAGVDTNAMPAGIYIITINDNFNCGPIQDTVNIVHPDQFLIDILSNTPNPCFGDEEGELTLTASGGTVPYNKLFVKDDQGDSIMVYTSTISGLSASDYYIWAIDANGCPSDTLKAVKIGEPGEIEININNLINSTCFGSDDGILEVFLISGTSPYNYELLENGDTIAQGNINQTTLLTFDNLVATSYLLSITDYNNCPKDSIIEITQPNQVIADFTSDNTSGKETFTVTLTNNSQGADVFYWDYDDGNQEILGINEIPTHSYNKQGQYKIMLVAENSLLSQNCNATTFVTIDVQGFDVFNVFSPNDDGVNDIFDFDGWSLSSMYVEIYNRWGEKIYHWDSPNGSWNGETYNDDDAPDGVYYFYLKANGEDGYLYQQQGSITLLR